MKTADQKFDITINSHKEVEKVFELYPEKVLIKISALRNLILKCADEIEEIKEIEECLKWGEPSYLVKHGSTIRLDWKTKNPTQYALYFKCTSRLVPTFKNVFKQLFEYEGNRAIVFSMQEELPEEALKECIKAALLYHKVKHLPTLGLNASYTN